MVYYLIGKYLPCSVMNKKFPNCLIIPIDTGIELSIDILEMADVACLFRDNITRKDSMSLWEIVMKVRPEQRFQKILPRQSQLEELVFAGKREVNSLEETNMFSSETDKFWKSQAFFACKRISKKYDICPNRYVYKLYKFTLRDWSLGGVNDTGAFAYASSNK